MSYDIDLCNGITYDNNLSPLRHNCKRFMKKRQKIMPEKMRGVLKMSAMIAIFGKRKMCLPIATRQVLTGVLTPCGMMQAKSRNGWRVRY